MRNPILLILFILALIPTGYAQNIVPNYSFEQADSCPTDFNNRSYKYALGCVGWGQATTQTPDYFNACDTAAVSIGQGVPIMGVPHNAFGYQIANDGVAYTGIWAYSSNTTWYKEYLIRNIPALQKDSAYKVTIHVSLADSSRYAVNGIGVLFTTYGSPNQTTGDELHQTPQIDYTTHGVISDTVGWTTLSKVFVADSVYTNLIIGGFKSASDMTIIPFNDSPKKAAPYAAYYYIDNVIVEKLSSTKVLHVTNSNLNVYPNPFTDYATLTFRNHSMEEHSFELYNAQGQVVQVIGKVVTDRLKIERNDLPAGFYYYKLTNNNREAMTGKLIIQ